MAAASIRALLDAPRHERDALLDHLVPARLLERFSLPPPRGRWEQSGGVFREIALPGGASLRIEVWPDPAGEDPALVLELTDTYYGQLEAAWIVLNDIRGPRYHVDRAPDGRPLAPGSPERNIKEEIRALQAGLVPNQVRPGLRMFRPLIEGVQALASAMGTGILYVAPLAYHNAIKYEQYGFTYAGGQEELEWIHREFLPGGVLRQRMDGSRPFRMPWMADTIRGRSWAIHDGVLERRWMAPQMYKFVGRDFSTRTCPDVPW